jgi:hypothetical protein
MMFTEFPHEDGSTTIRSNGYSLDFVAHLAAHLAYLRHTLAPATSFLDLSMESVARLDVLLTYRQKEATSLPDELIRSTVAYCGEVLRTQLGGEWFFYVSPADKYGGERYFPAIQSAEGKHIEFYGFVEREFERFREFGRFTEFSLYSSILFLTLPKILVQEWESHPLGDDLFPPLEKAPPLRKIFPAKE